MTFDWVVIIIQRYDELIKRKAQDMNLKSRILRATMSACLLGALLITGSVANAADGRVTFTKDVLPILQNNCVVCHRESGTNLTGMIAPMSLTDYAEVRPWAKAIKRAVVSKSMPPWHATDETHGVFRNERTISDDQIATISNWVDSGAVRGDAADAPLMPVFNDGAEDGWTIGTPDLIVSLPEPYWVPDEAEDIQPRLMIEITEEMLPEARFVKAVEFRPGSEVLHHIVAAAMLPEDGDDLAKQVVFGRIAPGTNAQVYEDGYGFELRPNTTVMMQMHYHKEAGPGTGVFDQSTMAIKFSDVPVVHPVEITSIAYGNFEIPPQVDNWKVGASKTFDQDFVLIDFMPHMHLRGSSARYTAFYPDGTSELLVNVPDYDYNWQTAYEYATYKPMPAGTRIDYEMTFNNSTERGEEAGVNPDRPVRFGGPTTEEMDLGFLTYALQAENERPKDRWGEGGEEIEGD